jgi:hypothetical protein
MICFRDGFKFEVSSKRGRGVPGLRIERRRPGAGAGGKMRKTNPISPRRRRLTEEIVQNEAKFGWTGVCRQRLSCGAWLGRGAECAKRTQFHLSAREWTRNPAHDAPAESDCAKRTQFTPGCGRMPGRTVRNEPNWGRRGEASSKSECRNPKQIRMSQNQMLQTAPAGLGIGGIR